MNKVKLIQSLHYLFLFKIDVSDEAVKRFTEEVEKRREDIIALMGFKGATINIKPVYMVARSEYKNHLHGTGNLNSIQIYVNDFQDIYENINLVIHEETHFILSALCPEVSAFINEGIAEYVCWKYTNREKPAEFMQNIGHICGVTCDMILSKDNWMKEYQKRGIWIYGVACLYIEKLLEYKITISELLQEIYRNHNTEIIKIGLEDCLKMGASIT